MGQKLVDMGECKIGTNANQLEFTFTNVEPQLTQIFFTFTNFKNPWSSITLNSVRVDSFSGKCEGDPQATQRSSPLNFYSSFLPAENVKLSSSSTVTGDSSPAVTLIIKFTPILTTSLVGRGEFSLVMPSWFDKPGKTNMMYNERDRDQCRSEAFDLISSEADIIS